MEEDNKSGGETDDADEGGQGGAGAALSLLLGMASIKKGRQGFLLCLLSGGEDKNV